jgi:hypothetical protein
MAGVNVTDDQAAPAVAVPVAALAYSPAEEPRESFLFLMKLVVAVVAFMSVLDLFRTASIFWIHFSPTPFKGVGTGWGRGSTEAVIGLATEAAVGVSATLLALGAVQFFRRRGGARRLLLWGAVASLAASVASFALSLLVVPLMRSAGNELRSAIVLTVWRVRWVLGPMMPTLLLLLALPRPEVRRWLLGER